MAAPSSRRIALDNNVLDEALLRIEWIFDEFENVCVGVSGGKDSTVVMELTKIVAKRRNRLPLEVFFLDQEAEWMATIEYLRKVNKDPAINMNWLQAPFRIFNATSSRDYWLKAWDPEKEDVWMREKEPGSIRENTFKTDRFVKIFPEWINQKFKGQKCAYISGVRTEESPTRFLGLTSQETYKGRTWGKYLNKAKGHYTLYPIYDWTYMDVWKAIHDFKWKYCKIYDEYYRYGVPTKDMRVSNLHHETAVRSLFMLQELEPDTYNRLAARLGGVDTAGKLNFDDFYGVKKLPPMFNSWEEYRDYLTVNLLENEEWHDKFFKKYLQMDELLKPYFGDSLYKKQITSIMTNDHEFVKLNNIQIPKEHYDDYRIRKKDIRERDSFMRLQRDNQSNSEPVKESEPSNSDSPNTNREGTGEQL